MATRGRIVWIEPDAPAKPPPGAPCNGCGVCCLLAPCPVGIVLSRRWRGPCAALRWVGAERRYRCGALLAAEAAARSARGPLARAVTRWRRWLLGRWIAAGRGCDCDATVEPPHDP